MCTLTIMEFSAIRKKDYDKLEENFESGLNPISLDMLRKINLTPAEFKRLYYGDEKISSDNADKFVEWWTDLTFMDGIHQTLADQVRNSSAATYFYRFCYDKFFSVTKLMANTSMPGL